MEIQEKVTKLTQVFDNEEVMRKLSMAESLEAMQAIFAENGVEMSIDDVKEFILFMNKKEDGTLAESELDQVAGGSGVGALTIFAWAWKGTKKIARYCWEAGRWAANHGF